MAKQVFLHIGPPKTGTSFIQQILWSNTERLSEAGVVLPFKNALSHRVASRTLRGDPEWTNRRDSARWSWDRFVAEVHATDQSVLFSAEDLASAMPADVARAIDSLSPATVHVIATARDLGRQFPSAWQNAVKNGQVATLNQYVRRAIDGRSSFWISQDVPVVIERWLQHIPVERVHLVTVPKSRASAALLWTRFAGVIGVDGEAVQLPEVLSNVSLGAVQAEVLRKVYAGFGTDLSERVSLYRAIRSELLPVLGETGERARPIRLRPKHQRWVAERGNRMLQELQQLGVDLRGEWEDLVPDESTAAEKAVSLDEELEVALEALRGLVVRAHRPRRQRGGGATPQRILHAIRWRAARARRIVLGRSNRRSHRYPVDRAPLPSSEPGMEESDGGAAGDEPGRVELRPPQQ